MSLAQELQIVKSQSDRGCKLWRWLNQLENKDKEAAVDALNSDLTSAAIHRAFKNYGFDGSESVVWKHRHNMACAKCKGSA